MEQVRNWLYSMLCTGCICSLIMLIHPEGKTKNFMETACACTMIFTLISPICHISPNFSFCFDDWTVIESSAIKEYSLSKAYMETQYSAYILNEAQSFGIELSDVSVCVETDSDLNVIPYSVSYRSTQTISNAFKEHITRTLGIPEERQFINEGSETVHANGQS